MLRILEILIVIVLLAWVLGFFVPAMNAGGLIHLLLVVLLIIIVLRVVMGRGPRL